MLKCWARAADRGAVRILRHLSFSNVIAVIALFVALGGAAYAGSKINGRKIVRASIGGAKLKDETITAKQIKKGTITGAQIKEGSLGANVIDLSNIGTVPLAQSAVTATHAAKATSAQAAATATNATNAETAAKATTAESARHATEADNAKHATEADNANHATDADNAEHAVTADAAVHAAEADRAATAGDAETIGGRTASELTVSCRTGTELYGGMCWDDTTRAPVSWLSAVNKCGEEGGRLPSIAELIAFVLRPGLQVSGQTWSGDLAELESGSEEIVLTSDEATRATATTGLLGYRCVFYRSN